MNHSHNQLETNSLDQSILVSIELLVERELSDEACRALLEQVALQPQYWKIMAVAFVEQQRIGRCVREMAKVDGGAITLHNAIPVNGTIRRSIFWAGFAALAASLLLTVITLSPSLDRFGFKQAGVHQPSGSGESESQEPNDPNAPQSRPFPVAPNVAGYMEWPGELGSKLLPVFHGLEVDPQWLELHPPQLDKRMIESLTRAGWQVNPSRHFVSIKLIDGEAYTIPVDDIRYRFVGHKSRRR
jgi:hypothetical protein